jgi:ferredoxin
MRIEADAGVCIGSGNCVLTAPDLFDQDDDGIVRVLQAEPPSELEDDAHEAAERCPSQAISLR